MVTKVQIVDNTKSPIGYLSTLKNFKNGTVYKFNKGVNIIVGENGSGKTTLLNLIKYYLLVGEKECDKGLYNSNINRLYGLNSLFSDGVSVFADYKKNVFRLCHEDETSIDNSPDFDSFGTYFTQRHSSTGESVNIALSSLIRRMYSENAKLYYDYSPLKELYPKYIEYIEKHRIDDDEEWTILMDEPDRNLDINNINEVQGILSFHKEQTQIIAVIHNPLMIYSLSKCKDINFIELTDGYINNVCRIINEIVME
jgi:predicted ATPase